MGWDTAEQEFEDYHDRASELNSDQTDRAAAHAFAQEPYSEELVMAIDSYLVHAHVHAHILVVVGIDMDSALGSGRIHHIVDVDVDVEKWVDIVVEAIVVDHIPYFGSYQ